jgi:hypothetical protein
MVVFPNGTTMSRADIMKKIGSPADTKAEMWLKACGGCNNKSQQDPSTLLSGMMKDKGRLATAELFDGVTVAEARQLVDMCVVKENVFTALQLEAIRAVK